MSARLENWKVVVYPGDDDGYHAPEACRYCLMGDVYNHPKKERFYNGKAIRTSPILSMNLKKMLAKTRNTNYELGVPDSEWLEWVRTKRIKGYEVLFND
jgi:hypothetical protein